MKNKSKLEIFNNIRETLSTVKIALEIIETKDPKKRYTAIRNFIVFGRSVTFVIQNLKSVDSDFDQWYKPYQDKMKNDKMMNTIVRMRNEILKEGKLDVKNATHIISFNSNDLVNFKKPKNAISFFMGDRLGGNGWEILMPDGSIENYYIDLPESYGYSTLVAEIGDSDESFDLLTYTRTYYDFLSNMVKDAEQRFLK